MELTHWPLQYFLIYYFQPLTCRPAHYSNVESNFVCLELDDLSRNTGIPWRNANELAHGWTPIEYTELWHTNEITLWLRTTFLFAARINKPSKYQQLRRKEKWVTFKRNVTTNRVKRNNIPDTPLTVLSLSISTLCSIESLPFDGSTWINLDIWWINECKWTLLM